MLLLFLFSGGMESEAALPGAAGKSYAKEEISAAGGQEDNFARIVFSVRHSISPVQSIHKFKKVPGSASFLPPVNYGTWFPKGLFLYSCSVSRTVPIYICIRSILV